MNKKQEALRRGLRSFIEDTSLELADLEGRAPGPHPDPAELPLAERTDPRAAATAVITSSAPIASEPPAVEPPPPQAVAVPPPGAPEGEPHQVAAPSSVILPPEPVTTEAASPPAAPPSPEITPRPRTGGAKSPRPRATTRSAKRTQDAPRRRWRARPTPDLGVDGVSPEQARARKGVCFAYFLNRECWRVPQAYCNSALQVCIMRECPVYHLHKEALEHRFAKKFRNFW